MTNQAQVAKILEAATIEYKNVKRNKSGSINGNALNAIHRNTVAALTEAGVTGKGDNTSLSNAALMVNALVKELKDQGVLVF